MTSPSHAPRRPIPAVPVLAGQPYSRNCGGEQRCSNEVAPHDGIAINGVLYTLDEYLAPMRALEDARLPVAEYEEEE